MKKVIFLSALLASAISTIVYSQSSPETMSRVRDATIQANVANVTTLGTNQAATQHGLNTAAGCYYYSGTQWYQWTGALANSDAVAPATTRAPYIQGMGLYFDGTNWRRMVGETWDTSMTAAPNSQNVNAFNVFYNLDGAAGRRWEGETLDTSMTAAPVSPNVNALNTFYNIDASVMRRWEGQTLDDVGTATAPTVPYVGAYNLFLDTDTNIVRRLYGTQVDDAMGFPFAPYMIGLTSFADGANYRKWTGDTGNNGVSATQVMPYVHGFSHFYHTNDDLWDRATSTTSADNLTATPQALNSLSYMHFYDGTNFRRWLGASLGASLSAPVTAPYIGSIVYGYDSTGPTYYPLKTDANGVYVHQADLLPGEDAVNDWRRVRTQSVNTYTQSAQTTASVDNSGNTIIYSSTEILGYSQFTVNVKNTGGVNSLASVVVDVSPNGSDWSVLDTYVTVIAAGGFARTISVHNNSDRYVRVRAVSSAATTSTDCYLTARISN
jgi:hypothetical protein